VQAQYESLKTKYRIADDSSRAAEKRAQQMEGEARQKNDQLEELYG